MKKLLSIIIVACLIVASFGTYTIEAKISDAEKSALKRFNTCLKNKEYLKDVQNEVGWEAPEDDVNYVDYSLAELTGNGISELVIVGFHFASRCDAAIVYEYDLFSEKIYGHVVYGSISRYGKGVVIVSNNYLSPDPTVGAGFREGIMSCIGEGITFEIVDAGIYKLEEDKVTCYKGKKKISQKKWKKILKKYGIKDADMHSVKEKIKC